MPEQEVKSLTVVLPAYNEEEVIGRVLRGALGYLPKVVNDFEVVIVDLSLIHI